MEEKDNFYEIALSKRDSLYPKIFVDMVDRCLGEVIKRTPVEIEMMANPEPVFYLIRDSFWEQLAIADKNGKRVNVDNILNGIMPRPMFEAMLKKNRYLAAWMVLPVVKYEKRIKSMLDSATKRYEEILTMPLKSKKFKKMKVNGEDEIIEWEEYDMNRVSTWLRLMKQLEDRVLGGVVQKQLSVSAEKPKDDTAELDAEAIDKKLKELEKKMNGDIIDIS